MLVTENVFNVYVKFRTFNQGTMVLKTNENLKGRGTVKHSFNGKFINSNMFVVQHDSSNLPIQVTFYNSFKRHWYSCTIGCLTANFGDMVLSSNGTTADDDEFLFGLSHNFWNGGSIAVLGTKSHQARLKLLALPPTDLFCEMPQIKNSFENRGYLFLKNAELHQLANFTRDPGCVALGENSHFIANTTHEMSLQKVYFHPGKGHALLHIQVEEKTTHTRYTVVNFPKGSEIRVDAEYTQLGFGDDRVIYISSEGKGIVTIWFQRMKMSRDKFQMKNGILSYKEDAFSSDDVVLDCEDVLRVMRRSTVYEITA